MTASLLHAELRSMADVASLNGVEAAELFDELRAAAIPLGDRSRLRKASEGLEKEKARRHYHQTQVVPGAEDAAASLGEHDRRQLQSGGGFSIEVAAIVVTGLIGMIGYIVQARSAQKASQAQARLGRKAAEREKAETKAGKQLERVQLQMAEWVRPINIENNTIFTGWFAIAKELQLVGYLDLYSFEFFPQPGTPYIDLPGFFTNPAHFAALGRAPFSKLPPEDIVLLDADAALRSRYCELAVAILLPPLRRMNEILGTKLHLNESLAPARLDPVLPGIGRDWTSFAGTLTSVYYMFRVYTAQFESLAGRWEQDQFDLLQPDSPGLHHIMAMLIVEQLKDVGAKEVELVGMSSGSRSAAGALNYTFGGVKQADT
jgi:hypothetical protein